MRAGLGAERHRQPCGRSQWLQAPSAIGLAHSDTYCSLRRSHGKATAALPQLPRSRRRGWHGINGTRGWPGGRECFSALSVCVSSPRRRFDFHRRSSKKLKSGRKIYLSLFPRHSILAQLPLPVAFPQIPPVRAVQGLRDRYQNRIKAIEQQHGQRCSQRIPFSGFCSSVT